MCLSELSANNPTSFSGRGLASRAHSCQRIKDAATVTHTAWADGGLKIILPCGVLPQDLLRDSAPASCDDEDSLVGTVPSFYISDVKGSCKLSGAVIPAQGRAQTPEH